MQKRKLGQTGLEIAPLAFGGNVFGWTVDEKTSHDLLDGFHAAGFNLIDTADVYSAWVPGNSGGESETIIGTWMKRKGNRDKIVIATKVGQPMAPQDKGLKKDRILRSVEGSLKRLQTDYIDLYQSHIDDPETPQDETLSAYAQLLREGKVRAIGASQYSARRLREALELSRKNGIPAYQTLQPEYNLYDRQKFESEYRTLCQESGIAVICYYGLANGFLSGKYRSEADLSKSIRGPRVKGYMTERGFRILRALDEVARRYRSKPATVALAWLTMQPTVTAPIASATTLEQLDDLTAIAGLKLDHDAIDTLNRASAY